MSMLSALKDTFNHSFTYLSVLKNAEVPVLCGLRLLVFYETLEHQLHVSFKKLHFDCHRMNQMSKWFKFD